MTLPQSNATLTRVTGGATTEDFDRPAGDGSPLWEGEERVYWQEKRERTFGAEQDVIQRRSLIVQTGLRQWTNGETATITPDGGETITCRVQTVEARSLPGVPAGLQTTRLTMEAA